MKLNIVLFAPEIPQNTGNIARTCVGFNAKLHLIKPYGFVLNDKNLKRSGLDYWNKLKMFQYDSYNDFCKILQKTDLVFFITRYGKKTLDNLKLTKTNSAVYLIFGNESQGIEKKILLANQDKTIRIPISKKIRCLNLANCVAICAYEFAKNNNFFGLSIKEPHKYQYLK